MRKLFALLIIFLIPLFIVRGWWQNQISPVSKDNTPKTVIVQSGASVEEIGNILLKENLIHSTLAFKLLVKQKGMDSKLSAGTFELSEDKSLSQIIDVLASSPVEKWVTLIEGWRDEEIAQKLSDSLDIDKDDFLKVAKEGYMFPDTYLIPHDYNAKNIADLMISTFDQKYTDELKSKIKSRGLTEKEGVILASIVEREARSPEAKKMVASILLKRFKIGMGLNTDATIQYAIGYQPSEKSWWKRNLTRDDLAVKSPFNTYIHAGLPPTPICNPGLASLQAVAAADSSTPYLYYYHDSKGVSHYGKTLDEHNENVATYP